MAKYLDQVGLAQVWAKITAIFADKESKISGKASKDSVTAISNRLDNAEAAFATIENNYLPKSSVKTGTISNAYDSDNTAVWSAKTVYDAYSTLNTSVGAKLDASAVSTASTVSDMGAGSTVVAANTSIVKDLSNSISSAVNNTYTKSEADSKFAPISVLDSVYQYKGSVQNKSTDTTSTDGSLKKLEAGIASLSVGFVYNVKDNFSLNENYVEYNIFVSSTSSWQASEKYSIGDIVKNSNVLYICKTNTDGDTSFPTSKFDTYTLSYPAGTNISVVASSSSSGKSFDILAGIFAFEAMNTNEIKNIIG